MSPGEPEEECLHYCTDRGAKTSASEGSRRRKERKTNSDTLQTGMKSASLQFHDPVGDALCTRVCVCVCVCVCAGARVR